MTHPLRNLPTPPLYSRSLDFEALYREYPPAPEYFDTVYRLPTERIRELQEARFLETMRRGWEVPFYQLHWRKAGLEPGDIRSLDDLHKIPSYDVNDLRESLERNPPWGDYWGLDVADGASMPLVLQTSGGTTGFPRPMIYSPRDREVMSIMGGRRLLMQGVRPGDLVQVTLSMGMTNAGMVAREYIWKYTGAIAIPTGSGASTSTRRQIELAQHYKTNVMIGIASYLRHMGLVARDEMNIDPRSLGVRLVLCGLGPDSRDSLEELWGATVLQQYGSNESGMVASECMDRHGLHIHEDGYVIEIVDPETSRAVPLGDKGNIYTTCLYKYAAPVIRFNTNDVSAFCTDACTCGGTHKRLQAIFGRADNMVRLRGINVFPEAIGTLVGQDVRCSGEYFCTVDNDSASGAEEMLVQVEAANSNVDRAALTADLERRFKETLSVRVEVQVVDGGALDALTGLSVTSKIKRLADRRKRQ